MNFSIQFLRITALAGIALAFWACSHVDLTHVPPGQSLGVALARKADLVRLPSTPHDAFAQRSQERVPALEPDLPKIDNNARVAEAFSRGEFCMNTGNNDEAIAAFEEAVKIDPTFADGWQRLALLYEQKGDTKKAMDAFRRSKKIASQQHSLSD